MQDHRTEDPDPSEEEQDFAILDLLLHEGGGSLWSADELAAELGSTLNVQDALARLSAAGLVHRLDGFAFPTPLGHSLRAAGELGIPQGPPLGHQPQSKEVPSRHVQSANQQGLQGLCRSPFDSDERRSGARNEGFRGSSPRGGSVEGRSVGLALGSARGAGRAVSMAGVGGSEPDAEGCPLGEHGRRCRLLPVECSQGGAKLVAAVDVELAVDAARLRFHGVDRRVEDLADLSESQLTFQEAEKLSLGG
jgi:hypothetical protein